MASHRIPANPVGLYWVWWNPFRRLSEFPTTYNVIFLFHAYPADGEATGGNTGAVVLRKPGGTIGSNLNADIATCRARGQKIIVSVGGAGGQVYITSQARADAFIASFKSINVGLGGSGTTLAIDGIDWNNFEGVQQGAQGTWMTYVGQQLRAYYGDGFAFTSPPAGYALPGGAQVTSDRLLLATLYQGGVLDWLCPQFYDPSNLNTLANARLGLDHYNTAITVNGQSVQIPRDYIGVGFAVAPTATDSRWSPSGAASAYSTLVSDGRAPKGAFNWANHEDTGNSFANVVAPVITNNSEPPIDTPAFSMSASANITDGGNTTAQLTAPSGKTTSDFQTGEIVDVSNPTPTIDLASGKYTEVEFSIIANSAAVDAAQYEFRCLYYNGAALETISVTPKWTIGTPPAPPDTTAPSVPAGLVATAQSASQINLTWQPSTDAVGVTGYKIYRDNVLIATSTTASYVDTGLAASTQYSYKVSAYDAATNESAQSSAALATTNSAPVSDTTPPVLTLVSPVGVDTISGTATLSVTATDNVGVNRVEFYIGGLLIGTDTTPSGSTFSIDYNTLLKPNGIYSYDVIAYDAAGNADHENTLVIISNSQSPPLIPDPPKHSVGVASMTGVGSITL